MPAGDQLTSGTAPWQVEIRGTLTGEGSVYWPGEGGIGGLDVPEAKTNDVDLAHAAGTYLGRDYTGPRTITIPYVMGDAGSPATAGLRFRNLSALWVASETDLVLHLEVAGFGHISFVGRPRGLLGDLSDLSIGFASALATFYCGNPTMTFIP